jgi:hypothetical protein
VSVAIELTVECEDEEAAGSLGQTLAPDNRYFPKDQRFESSRRGRTLRFVISSPRARPGLSTATSLLEDIKLFRDVWLETA